MLFDHDISITYLHFLVQVCRYRFILEICNSVNRGEVEGVIKLSSLYIYVLLYTSTLYTLWNGQGRKQQTLKLEF